MLGLECKGVSNIEMMAALRDAGLLSAPAGENVVRLLPPLIISEAQIDEAARAVGQACFALGALSGGKAAALPAS